MTPEQQCQLVDALDEHPKFGRIVRACYNAVAEEIGYGEEFRMGLKKGFEEDCVLPVEDLFDEVELDMDAILDELDALLD